MESRSFLPQRWKRPHLDKDADTLLSSVEQGLRVSLITTAREQLVTCQAEDNLRTIVESKAVERFDFLPVTETGDGRTLIRGLIHIAPFLNEGREIEGMVRDHMEPLSEKNLIGADAGILTFVRDADTHPCRLVVAGTEIVGLVSLSDLQRLPVRPVLFTLITHLELLMADVIRAEFGNGDAWKERLSAERRQKWEECVAERQASGMEVDPLLMTQFCDKTRIIAKSPARPGSRVKFESAMVSAEKLRNDVAHANDFAATPDAARQTCLTLRMIEEWISRLRNSSLRVESEAA